MDEQNGRAQCFVVMWFGNGGNTKDEMNQLFDLAIEPAISAHKLKPYRVDRDPSVDKLDETILNEIDKSDLVVVDLTHDRTTGLRGSVIFEAGYAYRIKPVIWMCREDVASHTPFDIRQFKQIRWNSNKLLDARQELTDAIGVRFEEQAKVFRAHEIRRMITEMWTNLESAKDVPSPESEEMISADYIRFVQFVEFCDDLDTRLKYKNMGLSNLQRYELIEMIRSFRKIVIELPQTQGKVASMELYRNIVEPRLIASGWK